MKSLPTKRISSGRRLRFRIFSLLTAVTFIAQPFAAAAEVIADPKAGQYRPAVESAPNGVPVVQITRPSGAGVSRNQFTKYNVNPQGVILNNSGANYVLTQQAGYIAGNPNVMTGSARIILNEVTSTHPSYLRGYTEVAGQKADVVIANPNGITCNGCGFINAGRGTLTTGAPVFGGSGSLDAFRVTGGAINIEGAGLNASNIDRVDIISRAIAVNSAIWAKELNIVSGANQVNYNDLGIQVIQGEGAAPLVGIDASQLGGMYAGRIRLIGTEAGVGVRSSGDINASEGSFSLTNEGKIILSGATAARGNIDIKSKETIENQGTIYSHQSASIISTSSVANSGIAAAKENFTIEASSLNSSGVIASGIKEDGSISSGGDVFITAYGDVVNSGKITAAGAANLQADNFYNQTGAEIVSGRLDINAANMLENSGTIDSSTADLNAASVVNRSAIFADRLKISADDVTNQGSSALIAALVSADINARSSIINKDSAVIYSMGDIALAASGSIVNESSLIEAENNIVAVSPQIINRKREFAAADQEVSRTFRSESIPIPGGYFRAERQYTETVVETVAVKDSPAAQMLAGSDITLDGSIENSYSTISAGRDIYFDSTKLNNISQGAIRITTKSGYNAYTRSERYCERRVFGACVNHKHRDVTDYVPYFEQSTEAIPGFTAILSANSSIQGQAAAINNLTLNANGLPGQSSTAAPGSSISSGSASIQQTGYSFNLPQNGLYTLHKEPDHRYLVETDPRFAGLKEFLSSDYMLSRLAYSPDHMQKKLGDGFYEQKVLRDQVLQLTGRRFLDGFTSDEQQFASLMEAGVKYAGTFNLTVGIALTQDQMSQLTSDMVWLVQEEVDGQKVLAPKLYIAKLHSDDLRPSGALIAANNIDLSTLGDLTNSGRIRSAEYTALSAKNITNNGGTIDSKGSIQLAADDDITNRSGRISGAGAALSAGRDINIQTAAEKLDVGILSTTRMQKQASVESSGNVTASAGRDINIQGAKVSADGNVSLAAAGSVRAGAVEHNEQVDAGFFKRQQTTNQTSSIQAKGDASITSGKDIELKGTEVSAQGDASIVAAGNITASAVRDRVMQDVFADHGTGNSLRTKNDDETSIGSQINAGGSFAIGAVQQRAGEMGGSDAEMPAASGNILVEGSSITSQTGSVVIAADKDITIKEAREAHENLTESRNKKRGIISSKTTAVTDHIVQDAAVSSLVSGQSVAVAAGNDITVQGSNVAGSTNVDLAASNNINIATAKNYSEEEHQKTVKKSGIFTAGSGLMFGTQNRLSLKETDAAEHTASVIGSVEGDISLKAGRDIKVTGSDLIGKKDIALSGDNVDIDAAYNTMRVRDVQEVRTSGLSIKASGGIVDAIETVAKSIDRAGEVKDDRLKAIYAYRAADRSEGIINALDKAKNVTQLAEGVQVKIGYSNSKSRTESITDASQAQGSNINSQSDVNITAAGDIEKKDGDITVTGSNIQAQNITLDAARDVLLRSAKNTINSNTQHTSSSSGFGVAIGATKGSVGVSIYAEGSKAKGKEDENTLTHSETTLTAEDKLGIKSGQDTTLKGAIAKAETIKVEAGRDLNIESEQDAHSYHAKNESISAGAQVVVYGAGGGSAYFNYQKGKTDAEYKSVQEQSGLYAGQGGYDIDVKRNTDLKGAVIASEASADKNNLQTETLTYSDLKNESSYSSSSMGVGISGGYGANSKAGGSISPSVGIPGSDHQESITKSAVSAGTISTKSDIASLSRDTANANRPIADTFDKEKVAEQQELSRVFSEEAFKIVGDIAKSKTRPYEIAKLKQAAAENYLELKNKETLTESEAELITDYEKDGININTAKSVIENAKIDQIKYQEQYEQWKDGSAIKIALHTIVGGAAASLGSGSILSGAAGAGASEAAAQLTAKLQDDSFRQIASAIIGAAAAKATGGNDLTGAATAIEGEKNNREIHKPEIDRIKELAKGDPEKEKRLFLAACAIAHCGEQLPEGPEREYFLAMQKIGSTMDQELLELKAENLKPPALFGYSPFWDGLKDSASKMQIGTRTLGVLQAAGGTIEAGIGISLAPTCTTGIGCVAAGVLTASGIDNAAAGIKTSLNGTPQNTLLNNTLQAMGLSPEAAMYIEMAISAGVGTTAGIANAGKTITPAAKTVTNVNTEQTIVRFEALGLKQNPLEFSDGIGLVRELEKSGLTTEQAVRDARQFIKSGSTLPSAKPIDRTDTLIKIVPEGKTPSADTRYWVSEAEFNALKQNPAQIAERLGLPKASQAMVYDIFVIKPKRGAVVFESQTAPTIENGIKQSGGAIQTIVPNRNLFTQPVKIDTIGTK